MHQLSFPAQPVLQAPGQGAGEPGADVYQRLLRERIVFLGTEVDDRAANLICAQLLAASGRGLLARCPPLHQFPWGLCDGWAGDLRHDAVRAV